MPPTSIPVRPPVSNESWDPEAMLAKAEAGAYPTAKSRRPAKDHPGLTDAEAEVAYWRARCGMPADIADVAAEAEDGEAHHGHDAALDAAFLELGPRKRQALVRSYLMGAREVDQERGAHLCRLAGLDVEQERRAAARQWDAMMRRCQERLRAQPARRGRAQGGQEAIPW